MKTVREIFRDGIEEGDWEAIRLCFKAITGEEAPEAPKPLDSPGIDDILNQGLDVPAQPAHPLDQMIEYEQESDTTEDAPLILPASVTVEEDDDEDADLVAPEEEYPQVPNVKKGLLAIGEADDEGNVDVASEFYIDQGQDDRNRQREDGETVCRKEPMSIPDRRKNRFKDNGKAFADQKMSSRPDAVTAGLGTGGMSERERNESELVRVQCGLCDTWEDVSPMLATRYHKDPQHNTYRCNTCTSPSGRAKAERARRQKQMNGRGSRRQTRAGE